MESRSKLSNCLSILVESYESLLVDWYGYRFLFLHANCTITTCMHRQTRITIKIMMLFCQKTSSRIRSSVPRHSFGMENSNVIIPKMAKIGTKKMSSTNNHYLNSLYPHEPCFFFKNKTRLKTRRRNVIEWKKIVSTLKNHRFNQHVFLSGVGTGDPRNDPYMYKSRKKRSMPM